VTAQRVLVVARSSFLARKFRARNPDIAIRAVGHDENDLSAFRNADTLVNFSFAPELHRDPCSAALDVDRRIAAAIGRDSHYVMISSRRVYAAGSQWNAREDQPAHGIDTYGANKVRVERVLGLACPAGELQTTLRDAGRRLAAEQPRRSR
jgi:hypothetical protein